MALPIEVQIVIMGHLTVTSERPMDNLHSLSVTCSSMRHFCGDPTVGRHLALYRFRHRRTWDDPVDYKALLASLTQVGSPEDWFLTRIQTILMEKHSPGHAMMISPAPLMAGTIWWPIWSPYCSIGTMTMPAMMTL